MFLGFRRRRIAHRRDIATPASATTEKESESSSDSSSTSSESHSSSTSSEEEKAKREDKVEIDEIAGPDRPVPGNT